MIGHESAERVLHPRCTQDLDLILEIFLARQHVESSARKDPLVQGPEKRFRVDEIATRGIDKKRAPLDDTEALAIEQVVRARRGRNVQSDHVGATEQLIHRNIGESEHLGQKVLLPHVMGEYVHAKSTTYANDVKAYVSGADH